MVLNFPITTSCFVRSGVSLQYAAAENNNINVYELKALQSPYPTPFQRFEVDHANLSTDYITALCSPNLYNLNLEDEYNGYLVSGTSNGSVYQYEMNHMNNTVVKIFDVLNHESNYAVTCIKSYENLVVSCGEDGNILLFELGINYSLKRRLSNNTINDICFSNKNLLYYVSGSEVGSHDIRQNATTRIYKNASENESIATHLSTSHIISVGDASGKLSFYDIRTRQLLFSHDGYFHQHQLSSGGMLDTCLISKYDYSLNSLDIALNTDDGTPFVLVASDDGTVIVNDVGDLLC